MGTFEFPVVQRSRAFYSSFKSLLPLLKMDLKIDHVIRPVLAVLLVIAVGTDAGNPAKCVGMNKDQCITNQKECGWIKKTKTCDHCETICGQLNKWWCDRCSMCTYDTSSKECNPVTCNTIKDEDVCDNNSNCYMVGSNCKECVDSCSKWSYLTNKGLCTRCSGCSFDDESQICSK